MLGLLRGLNIKPAPVWTLTGLDLKLYIVWPSSGLKYQSGLAVWCDIVKKQIESIYDVSFPEKQCQLCVKMNWCLEWPQIHLYYYVLIRAFPTIILFVLVLFQTTNVATNVWLKIAHLPSSTRFQTHDRLITTLLGLLV